MRIRLLTACVTALLALVAIPKTAAADEWSTRAEYIAGARDHLASAMSEPGTNLALVDLDLLEWDLRDAKADDFDLIGVLPIGTTVAEVARALQLKMARELLADALGPGGEAYLVDICRHNLEMAGQTEAALADLMPKGQTLASIEAGLLVKNR
ncbi:MAG: hypothetical protein PHT12_06450 [Patescibacteria group bacterium]|nr:hypothetical protein [Patescibacteria group bacterium]